MASIFKSGKAWIFAAATAVAGTIAGFSLGRSSKSIQNEFDSYDRRDLELLRDHVHQEQLTICSDKDGVTLQRLDRQGKKHPIRVNEWKDGSVQIDVVDGPESKTLQQSSYADKIISEKLAAAETIPGMVK